MGGFLMSMESNLIVKRISLERDKIDSFDRYPFNIDIVKNFDELNFDSQVTFLLEKMVLENQPSLKQLLLLWDYLLKVEQKILDMKQEILHLSYLTI